MTVRIGFVGAGFMGQTAHLWNYDQVESCEVVALAEPKERLRERVARRYDIGDTYTGHESLLSGADVDAVVAPQHFSLHHATVPDVLEAGYPVFTEKPLAVKPETGAALADSAENHGVLHMVGYHKRSDPAMEHAGEVVEEWQETGEYGEMRYVRVTVPGGDWIAGAPDPIATDEPEPDGDREPDPEGFDERTAEEYRSYINYYSHQINTLRFFMGACAVAFAGSADRLLVLEDDRGVTGVVEQRPYETSDDWQERVLVGFDEGYVRVDLPAPLARQTAGTVEVMRDDGGTTTTRPTMPSVAAMRRQAENFVAAVSGRRDPPCDSREAVGDLRIARDYFRYKRNG